MSEISEMGQLSEISQMIRTRLSPANPIIYNQSFPLAASIPQGESWLAAEPQKSRV
jgi:hypothetical protein